jgi:Transglutaminase-like superfamily
MCWLLLVILLRKSLSASNSSGGCRMLGQIAENLRRASGLSLVDWLYLAIAVKELFIARIRYATQTVGKILHELQDERLSCDDEMGVLTCAVDVGRLSWAIGTAAARVPWRSDCLLQVMAADRWLRRSRLRPDFFLGVAKCSSGALKAHAWLRLGNFEVTGGNGGAFTPMWGPGDR